MPIIIDIVDKAISIVAKRNSGKSYLLRYLVKKQSHKFNKIFVICPTDSINSFVVQLPINRVFLMNLMKIGQIN